MKRYVVIHRATKEKRVVDAPTAAEACKMCGWMIGDCYVREVRR